MAKTPDENVDNKRQCKRAFKERQNLNHCAYNSFQLNIFNLKVFIAQE